MQLLPATRDRPPYVRSISHGINVSVKFKVVLLSEMLLSTVEVYMIAMTLQALLTGLYLASFLLCLRWLIFSDDGGALRKPICWPFLTITIVLFTLSATDLGMSLQATLIAFQGLSITPTTLIFSNIIDVRTTIQDLNY